MDFEYKPQDTPVMLVGLEPVRKRPGMYIGDTDEKGYHCLAFEVIDNAVTEVKAGYCSTISVTLRDERTLTIEDDGRGIAPESSGDQQPPLGDILTVLHWAAKRHLPHTKYCVGGGLHAVGLVVVNALAESMIVDTYRDGAHYRIACAWGEIITPMQRLEATDRHGTVVTITPDREIFGDTLTFSQTILCDYLRHLAYLLPTADPIFRDEMSGTTQVFHYPDGIQQWVRDINEGQTVLHPVVHAAVRIDDIQAEIAFQFIPGASQRVIGCVNGVDMDDESAEIVGFSAGLIGGINDYSNTSGVYPADQQRLLEEEVVIYRDWDYYDEEDGVEDLSTNLEKLERVLAKYDADQNKHREVLAKYGHGLTAVISVWMFNVQYAGATRDILHSPQVTSIIKDLTRKAISECCRRYPDVVKHIMEKSA